jgi:hypothetical protein
VEEEGSEDHGTKTGQSAIEEEELSMTNKNRDTNVAHTDFYARLIFKLLVE